MNPLALADRPIPRVMRVEYCQRDKIAGGYWREWTEADVMTPFGEIHVNLPGYHAERPCYPALIDAAMDQAWLNFCSNDTFALLTAAREPCPLSA
jgi:hypothetical protein